MKNQLTLLNLLFAFSMIILVNGCREDDDVLVTRTNKLHAVAGDDRSVTVNEEVVIDGSRSYDGNNLPFTYWWSVLAKPQGSAATVTSASSAKATFTPDMPGTYLIQLRIGQENWDSKDTVTLTVTSPANEPAAIVISSDIVSATVLEDVFAESTQIDYIVTKDIAVNADLLIKPGVVIGVEEGKAITVVGSIQAIGTSDHEITFRGVTSHKGYWKGLTIVSNDERNELQHVRLLHGGAAGSGYETKAGLTLAGTSYSGAAVKLNNVVVMHNEGYGLNVQGASQLNQFTEVKFESNSGPAAFIPAGVLHTADGTATMTGNGFNGIETRGEVPPGVAVAWPVFTYLVSGDVAVRGGLTIQPGTVFKMTNSITVAVADNGFMNALGTVTSKILFTSNGDNVKWNGILINSPNSQNKLHYVEVVNAGLNKMEGAAKPGSIALGNEGIAEIKNSLIRDGQGFGIVAPEAGRLNQDVLTANTFLNLVLGPMFPQDTEEPKPPVEGVWLDKWSFQQGALTLRDNFYNEDSDVWFEGAVRPWDMNGASFGLSISANGDFTWTVAEHSPNVGCMSYSAEYMIGNASVENNKVTFAQTYWRSKFVNSCDESQNVDITITPTEIEIAYEIVRASNPYSGETYWELKFKNPDGSTFSYYRK